MDVLRYLLEGSRMLFGVMHVMGWHSFEASASTHAGTYDNELEDRTKCTPAPCNMRPNTTTERCDTACLQEEGNQKQMIFRFIRQEINNNITPIS